MGGGTPHNERRLWWRDLLICEIKRIRSFNLEVYIEGQVEAIALNAGYLATEVLDIVENSMRQTTGFRCLTTCHMPDVLENALSSAFENGLEPRKKPIPIDSSNTCLTGDVIGDYSFAISQSVIDFISNSIASFIKNNTAQRYWLAKSPHGPEQGDCSLSQQLQLSKTLKEIYHDEQSKN